MGFCIQDKCDMRPQNAHPLNNLTKSSVKKTQSPTNDAFSQMSPDFQMRMNPQGNVYNVFVIMRKSPPTNPVCEAIFCWVFDWCLQAFFFWLKYAYCVSCVSHIADFSQEHFGFDRDAAPLREWPRGYIGLPSQRKTSNCDPNRAQAGREAEGSQSSLSDAEQAAAAASLKG